MHTTVFPPCRSPYRMSSGPRQYRVFTFEVDGVPQRQEFDYPPGVDHALMDAELNRMFQEWLEAEMPGYYERGRISRIGFTDQA